MVNIPKAKKERLKEKIPFIIGITGHRDAIYLDGKEDEGLLGIKKAVKSSIKYWSDKLGDNTPIWLLSGMAEGADLLAVEAAEELSFEESWLDGYLTVIPCLPMEQDAYEKDFSNSQSEGAYGLTCFRTMMEKYQEKTMVIKNGLTKEDYQIARLDDSYGSLRNSLYLNQGSFIAKYSNVLIAIWDGMEAEGVGGTGEIVLQKCGKASRWEKGTRNESLSQLSDFDGQIGGVVQHLPVARKRKSTKNKIKIEKNEEDYTSQRDSTGELSLAKFYITYKNDTLLYYQNAYSKRESKNIKIYLSIEFTELITQLTTHNEFLRSTEDNNNHVKRENIELSSAYDMFDEADMTAEYFQSKYRLGLSVFVTLFILGLFFYEFRDSLIVSTSSIVTNTVILFSIISCFTIRFWEKKRGWKNKYQQCRSVAEGMRFRGFLNMADVAPKASPLLPRRYRKKMPLVNQAINVAEFAWWRKEKLEEASKVKKFWIDNQMGFLRPRISRTFSIKGFSIKDFSINTYFYKRPGLAWTHMKNVYTWVLFIAFIAGIFALLYQLYQAFIVNPTYMNQSLDIFINLLLFITAVVALWLELANYEATTTGYENLIELYERADEIICFPLDDNSKKMLYELAREAMQEHAEWNHFEQQSNLSER